jgi:hypothetical protein
MPPPVGTNWEMFLDEQLAHGPSELELKALRAGDRLIVGTKNTRYEFEWQDDGSAQLSTDRADRPWGQVTVLGCAFRRSGVLAPGVIFAGGKVEFVSTKGQVRHRTTPITSLTLVRGSREPRATAPAHSAAAG